MSQTFKGYVFEELADVFGTIVSKENNTGALARLYVNLRVEYLSDDKWELGTIVPSSTPTVEKFDVRSERTGHLIKNISRGDIRLVELGKDDALLESLGTLIDSIA